MVKVYVVTIHHIDSRHRFGPVIGSPKAFTTWDKAHRYGMDHVDYTRTDFRIIESEMTNG